MALGYLMILLAVFFMHPSLGITGCEGSSLEGKKIALALTGSVAAVRSFGLCRALMRKGAEVRVVMSKAAQGIITKEAMHYASGHEVVSELTGAIEHVELLGMEGSADMLLVAPSTSNTIGKIAQGIDDTTVTAFAVTALGSGKPILVVPAMHFSMYRNRVIEENIAKLRKMGVTFLDPVVGENKAKLPEINEIVLEVERLLGSRGLEGKRVVVTGGATSERIDPIRVLTNRASGKTGVEVAGEAYRLGAEVTLIHNHGAIERQISCVKVESAAEMRNAVMRELDKGADMFIASAAVGDFTLRESKEKIKSNGRAVIELEPAEKIIANVRKKFPDLFMVAFKAETNKNKVELERAAKIIMGKHGLDLVVANDVAKGGIGEETNKVVVLGKAGSSIEFAGKKNELAKEILGIAGSQIAAKIQSSVEEKVS